MNCIRLINMYDVVRHSYIRGGTATINRQREREKGGVSLDRKNLKRAKMTTPTPELKYQLQNWYL